MRDPRDRRGDTGVPGGGQRLGGGGDRAARFATATGINSIARQLGAVLGVALLLVAIVGTPAPDEVAQAFDHGWTFAGGLPVRRAAPAACSSAASTTSR